MNVRIKGGLALIGLFVALSATAADLQRLPGQMPRAAANLAPLGRLPATQSLSFAIGLPLRNQAALHQLLEQIYDPASPNYHHYLSPEQFTAQFGPTEQDYEAVAAYAHANGLAVTTRHANRTLLDVTGTVANVEKALHIRMNRYQHPQEARTFYAPDGDPSFDLAVPLAGISGLDDFARPRPRLVATRLANASNANPSTGSGLGGTYRGGDFRAAYVPGTTLTGTGQAVGLLQFDGYTASDITYYENQAGLPNVPLTNVLLDGFGGGPSGSGGEVEVSLDIEMAVSMAPGLSQVIVYMAGPYGNWHDILNRMANDNLARQLSCSWYIPNGVADPVADQIFLQMAAQGQSFLNASGDFGAYSGLISFPGDSPYITQVGGTFLTTSGPGGSYVSETTWNRGNGISTGGGISTQYGIPVWQAPVSMTANFGSATKRNTPDVALTADNVYVRADGSDWNVGGTSCAAPLWAGFASLLNQQAAANGLPAVGFLNPAVYKAGLGANYSQAFHDITTGNNGTSTHFPAVAGYDLCTGWGTPNGQQFINLIVPPDSLIISPPQGFVSSGAVGGAFSVTAQNFTLTNTSAGTLTWSVGNPAAWLSASAAGGLLPPGVQTNLTVSLNTAASNLPPGIYTANFAVTNVNSNFMHVLPFVLQVHDPLVMVPTNGFNATGPVGGPFTASSLNLSLSNSGLAALNWAVSNNMTWLNVSPGGGTLAAGAATNVTATLNGVASNLTAALYSGSLVFSNVTGSLTQSLPFSLQTGQLSLDNSGFELGNFNGWAVSGITEGMFVTTDPQFVHSGLYGAEMGSPGGLGYLTQALTTKPGQVYLISFWLENAGVGGPEEFQVNWNGSTIWDEVNVASSTWTNVQILVAATGTNTLLEFGARNDDSAFGLDDVNVFESPVPGGPPVITAQPANETVTAGWTATFAAGVGGIAPFYYQWQYGSSNIPGATNLTLVLSPATPGEAGNYSLVVSNVFGTTNSSNAMLTVSVPACDAPAAGLAGWWAAEDNANDSFGLNNGTLSGGVSFTNGVVGQAFQFDGQSGYVGIPASASLNVGTNAGLTIEGWIRPHDTSTLAPLLEWNNGAGSLGPVFWVNQETVFGGGGPGSLYADLIDINGTGHAIASAANILSTQGFSHVAVTYDKSSGLCTLYLNGMVVAAQNLGVFTPGTTYNVFLASRPAKYYYGGIIDELSIYGAALSSNQIQAIYNAGSAGKCAASPIIAGQPQNGSVFIGNTASFGVNAVGSQPLSYQWQLNGTNISALTNATATNALLILTNIQLNQSGAYSVLVANIAGSTNSSNAVLTVLGAGACEPSPSGLVSWWAAEGDANDSFATNNGTVAGGVSFAPGAVGQAFHFDGVTGYVNIPGSPGLNVGTNAGFTLEGWVKPADLSTLAPLVEWNNGAGSLGPVFWVNQSTTFGGGGPGSLYANLIDVTGAGHSIATGPNILSTNSFNHVAVTYDKASGICTLYLNGVSIVTQSLGSFTPRTTFNLLLAARPTSYYYGGLMDEMSLYRRALSGQEIQAIFNAGSAGKCAAPPLVASQPQSEASAVGSTASFSVTAFGTRPLAYQWQLNGTNISALTNTTATNATLMLANVQPGQSGNFYSVIVTNVAGSTNSSNAVLTVLGSGQCDPPPSGLVSWWAAEGSANDFFGTNNGMPAGGTGFTNGEVGQAFKFDGATGYVTIPASSGLNVGTNGGFTLEGWIKPAGLSTLAPLVEWNNGSGSLGPVFWVNQSTGFGGGGPGSLYANLIDVTGTGHSIATGPNILSTASFNHVAMTYDKSSGTCTLYLNGTNVASQNLGSFIPRTTFNMFLASRPSAYYYAGLIDEMSLYSRALSGSEILAIYNAGSAGKCTAPPPSCTPPAAGLTSWWAAEGNPNDAAGTNNGTLNGGVLFTNGEVGQAFKFDGATGYVSVPASATLNVGTNGGLTLEGWVKPAGLATLAPMVEWNDGAGGLGPVFWVNQSTAFGGGGPGSLYANLIDVTGTGHSIATGPNILSTTSFNHVAVTYDKSSGICILYLNGTNAATANLGSFTPRTTANVILASRPSAYYYAGLMDEMSLYSRALSGTEIQAVYSAGSEGKCTELPPMVTSQPTNELVPVGGTATFSVGVSGTSPLAFQWRLNLVNIPASANPTATNAVLVLANVQSTNLGNYSVVVTNQFGSTNSSNAMLTLLFPPAITLEPHNQLVQLGCAATFSSGAIGSGTLTYQWQKNGTNLTGQNGTNLALLNVQPPDFGNYTMIASNAYGAATSTVAVLALDHLPVPGGIIVQRFPGSGLRINAAVILANATDADGDPINLISVNTNSVAGGSVTVSGPSIYYLPPPGFTNADAFNYTLSDGHCNGTAVGTVLVEVRTDTNPASQVTIVEAGDGSVQVIFDGEPGVTYRVQSSDSLVTPDWQDVASLTANQYGTYIYADWPATNGPVRYFRSVSP